MARNSPPPGLDFNPQAFEEEADEMNNSAVEHLPEPPRLGGGGGTSDIHGAYAQTVAGRTTSPKLYAQASYHPDCTQFRVWKIENGIPVGLGVIGADSTEEDLCVQYRTAMPRPGDGRGMFKIRPLTVDGRELGQEVTVIISEHHEALRRLREGDMQHTAHPGTMGGMGGLSGPVVDLLRATLDQTTKALDSERTRVLSLQEQMAKERVDLAGNAAAGVQAMAERMMQSEGRRADDTLRSEQTRNQQMNDSMASFFQSQLELLRADRERQREEGEAVRSRDNDRAKAEIDTERLRREREMQEWERRAMLAQQDFDRRLTREQEEHSRRERREAGEAAEREKERDRQQTMKLREMELQAQRDREHAERMMQLQTAQLHAAGGGNLKDTLASGLSFLKTMGIEPGDLIQRFLAPPADTGGDRLIEAATAIAGTVGEVVKAKITADARVKQAMQLATMPHAPMGLLADAGEENETGEEEAPTPRGLGFESAAAPTAPAEEANPAASTLPLPMQRAARGALRGLVNTLKGVANVDEWIGPITIALTSEPAVYHYIQAVSVRVAVKEAGGDDAFATRVIDTLRTSSIVPPDLNFG